MQFDQFAYSYGPPTQHALFRLEPEDFIVEEQNDVEFSGEGEHFWLKVRKRGENTDWVAGKLAEYFSVKRNDVGYAGKKDRHAVTTQWFSVYLPGRVHNIDWGAFKEQSELDAELIDSATHSKKLKIGQHQANQFSIRLRNVQVDEELEKRLQQIQSQGVPNYFGEQRFGRNFSNIERVREWVADPRKRLKRSAQGMIFSAARSYLFNLVLSARLQQNNWLSCLEGEPFAYPSGPLWGRGRSLVSAEAEQLELHVLESYSSWCDALEHVGLSQERRELLLKPKQFSWSVDRDLLRVDMSLAVGQYATSVLRELVFLDNAVHMKEAGSE